MLPQDRQNISSASNFESLVGYSRAVRVGSRIYVSGTTATGENGAVVDVGDGYGQTIRALRIIQAALEEAGAGLANVVRTRMFVTDMTRWREYGRAHAEVFGAIRPVATMVEVRALIDPLMLIEIEADAEV